MSIDAKTFLISNYDRTDSRWSHPEIEDFYAATMEGMNTGDIYNSELPFEERKATSEAQLRALAELGVLPEMTPKAVAFQVPGCPEEPDAPEVTAYIVKPETKRKKLPCVLVIPGGGLYIEAVLSLPLEAYAERWGAAIVTLTYRHLYEGEGNFYPKALNDCHAVYAYLIEHAEEMGIDPDRMAINGLSSGGHLSLVLAHRLKRYNWCGGPMPRGVIADIPVTDCEVTTPSMHYNGLGWNGASAVGCGNIWLEGKGAAVDHPNEAFAGYATVEDCIGLPPTYIHTGDCDPAIDPDFAYASKLIQAGVFTEVHCWGGNNHAALTNSYGTDISDRFNSVLDGNVRDCLKYDLRRSWLFER